MEKGGVDKAKSAVSITKKQLKKNQKAAKKAEKKAEKRERKDIRTAYTKALKKGRTDNMLAVFAIVITLIPIAAQFLIDMKDGRKD